MGRQIAKTGYQLYPLKIHGNIQKDSSTSDPAVLLPRSEVHLDLKGVGHGILNDFERNLNMGHCKEDIFTAPCNNTGS